MICIICGKEIIYKTLVDVDKKMIWFTKPVCQNCYDDINHFIENQKRKFEEMERTREENKKAGEKNEKI